MLFCVMSFCTMPSAVLNAILPNTILLIINVVTRTDCHSAQCHFAECFGVRDQTFLFFSSYLQFRNHFLADAKNLFWSHFFNLVCGVHRDKARVQMPAKMFPHLKLLYLRLWAPLLVSTQSKETVF
jgi:hypothetical protein